MKSAWITLALVCALSACSSTPARLSVPFAPSQMEAKIAPASVMLRDITLPEYANGADVVRETPQGLIEPVANLIWADIPEDAMANAIVQHLSSITSRSVARAPWPLSTIPDAELTIRIAQMLLRADGRLYLSGQFAISRDRADRIQSFELAIPMRGTSVQDLAQAHAEAWRQLAESIAQAL